MSRRRLALGLPGLLAVSGLLVAGCAGDPEAGPPAILYGADICDHCRMVVSEERHAAGARLGAAEYRFDDPGCLVEFLESQESASQAVAWVHDENGSWLRVEEAWFVEDSEKRTPMGSGILAFGSEEAAAVAGEKFGSEPSRWPKIAVPSDGE